jgi:type 1 fimbria pilin
MQVKKYRFANHGLGRTAAILGIASGLALACADAARAGPLDTRASACTVNPGGQGPSGTQYAGYSASLYQIAVPIPNTFIIPSHPAPGEILLSGEVPLPTLEGGQAGAGAPLIQCPMGTIETFQGNGGTVPGMSDVYPTSVPGIGYRVYYYLSSDGQATAPAQFVNEYPSGVLIYPMNNSSSPYGSNMRTRIELVATGDQIRPGTISAAQVFGQGGVAGGGSAATTFYKVGLLNNVTVSQPTCGITNPSALLVTLPEVSTRQLATSGVGHMVYTTLQVACNAARDEAPAITLTTTNLAPQVPGTLGNQLTDGAAAQGVGVQVQYELPSGNAIPFEQGVATHSAGMPMGALPTDHWLFRLSAQFVRLGSASDLRPGNVRATATLTFTYN